MVFYVALVLGGLWLLVAREVDAAALLRHILRLFRLLGHLGRLATDSLRFCDQSAHYTQQFSSLRWVGSGF
jgi:hypothetical protein